MSTVLTASGTVSMKRMLRFCFAATLQKCFVDYETSPDFPLASTWLSNKRIKMFLWTSSLLQYFQNSTFMNVISNIPSLNPFKAIYPIDPHSSTLLVLTILTHSVSPILLLTIQTVICIHSVLSCIMYQVLGHQGCNVNSPSKMWSIWLPESPGLSL